MTLARRLAILMAAAVALALAATLAGQLLATRQALEAGLALRNRESAIVWAQALTQQRGEPAALQELLAAQARSGSTDRVQWHPAQGPVVETPGAAPAAGVPAWFAAWLPLAPAPGLAPVFDGRRELGMLRVEGSTAWALGRLWADFTWGLLWLAGAALCAAVSATWAVRRWQAPLREAVAQALALEQGRFIESPEPREPELRGLVSSLNATMRRLRDVFAAQAEQVQMLQRQAQRDAVTGLPLRRQFIGRLDEQLAEPGGPGAALILVRVIALDALNQRLGHEATDRLLAAAAGLLLAYVERVPGTFAGRLNGSDFALCLPLAGLAAETARSLHGALVAAPALHAGSARIVVGGVDGLAGLAAGPALAAADAALAQAEASGGLALQELGTLVADPAGARAWREQIATALADGRARLAEFRVIGREGQLLHLECPLRVQLSPGGEYHAAARWLAIARRSRLLPQVDLAALDRALAASAADGRPRAVHVALPSMGEPGFAADVVQRLMAAPQAARCLALEWVGEVDSADWHAVPDAAARWRACGVQLGVHHIGGQAQALAALGDLALDYVKVGARHLRGLAGDEAVRAYAHGLVTLIHGLGMQALAAGVDDESDLQALWALGFDGATGPAVAPTVTTGETYGPVTVT